MGKRARRSGFAALGGVLGFGISGHSFKPELHRSWVPALRKKASTLNLKPLSSQL